MLDNIANKRSFSLRMLRSPKIDKNSGEHILIRRKKALYPKESTVFDFMIRPPNDESPVIESPLLFVQKLESVKIRNTDSETTEAEFELVAPFPQRFH